MGVRIKLNVANVHGCLILAAFVGCLAGSWAVFLLSFAALVAGSVASGDIRPRPGRP